MTHPCNLGHLRTKVSSLVVWLVGAGGALAIHAATSPCDCADAILYSANAGYSQMAVDDAFVYFADNHGKIEKISKQGGAVTTLATFPGDRVITGLTVDSNTVYFGAVGTLTQFGYTANIGTIAAVSKNGGLITTLTTAATNVVFMAVDDAYVYWDSYGHFDSPGSFPQADGFIARVPKGGGAVEVIASNLQTSDGFALDGGDLYYGETSYVSGAAPSGAVKRVAKTGGVATLIYSGVGGYVATDADYVYVTSHFEGTVFRVPKAGGARQMYLSGLVFPGPVVLSGNQLYFAVDDNAGPNGFIAALDVNTGATQILQSGIPDAFPFTLDDCAVYAMGKDANQVGSLYRICRPAAAIAPNAQFSLGAAFYTVSDLALEVSIPIHRNGDASFAAEVTYLTADGSARDGVNYYGTTNVYLGQVQFQPGQTDVVVNIGLLNPINPAPDVTFTLSLQSPSIGAGLGAPTTATVTIVNTHRPGPGRPDPSANFIADVAGTFVNVNAVARQSDGAFVIGGAFNTVGGVARSNIARILAGGAVDASFDPGAGVGGFAVNALELQSDGKVIVAGQFSTVNGAPRNNLARLNADGSLDTAFSPPALAQFNGYNALAIQADGKILAGAGYAFSGTNLARFNGDGTLDNTFSVGSGVNGAVNALALLADGRILVGGGFTSVAGGAQTNIALLSANGAVDGSFQASVLGMQYMASVDA
ncbi:MAG: Calx-beta domain-containing protein, partial [Limisphaerales bacterium]